MFPSVPNLHRIGKVNMTMRFFFFFFDILDEYIELLMLSLKGHVRFMLLTIHRLHKNEIVGIILME